MRGTDVNRGCGQKRLGETVKESAELVEPWSNLARAAGGARQRLPGPLVFGDTFRDCIAVDSQSFGGSGEVVVVP